MVIDMSIEDVKAELERVTDLFARKCSQYEELKIKEREMLSALREMRSALDEEKAVADFCSEALFKYLRLASRSADKLILKERKPWC